MHDTETGPGAVTDYQCERSLYGIGPLNSPDLMDGISQSRVTMRSFGQGQSRRYHNATNIV